MTPDNLNVAVRALEKWKWQANLTWDGQKHKRDSKDELCEIDKDSSLQEPIKKQKRTAMMIDRINALEKLVQNLNPSSYPANQHVNKDLDR